MISTELLIDKADALLFESLREEFGSQIEKGLLDEFRLLRQKYGRIPEGTPQRREIPEEMTPETFLEYLGEFSGKSSKEILYWASKKTGKPIIQPDILPYCPAPAPEIEGLPTELAHKTPFGTVTLLTSHPFLQKALEEKEEDLEINLYNLLRKAYGCLRIHFLLSEQEALKQTKNKRKTNGKNFPITWEEIQEQTPQDIHTILSTLEALDLIKKRELKDTTLWQLESIEELLYEIKTKKPKENAAGRTEWTALTTEHAFLNLENSPIQEKLLTIFPAQSQRRYECYPLGKEGKTLVLAVHQLPQVQVRAEMAIASGGQNKLLYVLANKTQIMGLINKALSAKVNLQAIAGEIEHEDTRDDLASEHINIEALIKTGKDDETTVIQLLQGLIVQAVQDKATDIHVASGPESLSIRFRIDGVLIPYPHQLPRGLDRPLITRIKIVSSINTTKTGLPEDGKFATKIGGLEYEIRVTTCPTIHGEKAIMRIQPKNSHIPTLESLGFQGVEKQVILRAIDSDHGLLVICGPTGAGKSTTLYAAIGLIDRVQWNVVTGEQPVEIKIPGCEQTSITNTLTFEKFVTASLRQDPDYIMIGETRDKKTTEELVRAAITGHNVLTTLHTNSAPSAPARLIDLGAKPYLLADALVGVCAQRLLRRLCTNCSSSIPIPTARKLKELGIREEWLLGATQMGHPVGCKMCRGTGYAGRIAVIEGYNVSPAIRDIIQNKNADPRAIQALMEEQGSKSLFQHAVENVGRGICSLQDALAVQSID